MQVRASALVPSLQHRMQAGKGITSLCDEEHQNYPATLQRNAQKHKVQKKNMLFSLHQCCSATPAVCFIALCYSPYNIVSPAHNQSLDHLRCSREIGDNSSLTEGHRYIWIIVLCPLSNRTTGFHN